MKNLTKAALFFLFLVSLAPVSESRAEEDCSKIQTDIQEKNLASDSTAIPSEEKKETDAKASGEVD